MAEKAEQKGDVEKVVRTWLHDSGIKILNEEGDSDSSGGSDLTGGS